MRIPLIIGIDPGAKNGIAICSLESPGLPAYSSYRLSGTPAKDIPVPAIEEWVKSADLAHCDKVLCVIERSSATLPRFRAHRASGKAWEVHLRHQLARRNRIVYVDPQVWQRALGVVKPGNAGRHMALDYVTYAKEHVLPKAMDITEDEAAALCIAEYGRKILLPQIQARLRK